MYNSTSIDLFINKVNKEAEQAAQAVYDKYQTEFEQRLKAQIKTGDTIFSGMGAAFIKNSKGEYVGEKLSAVICANEYNSLAVGLFTPDKLSK